MGHINLAHTYLEGGGEGLRKAMGLYEYARKMRPADLSIRLYIARAYFGLQDYPRAMQILSDALQLWPDDVLLRYNLAVCLESYGASLVALEKKTKRLVGIGSGIDHMTQAVEMLSSAARLYTHVHTTWTGMSETERTELQRSQPYTSPVVEQMSKVGEHMEYCADIAAKAREELEVLKQKRGEIDAQMRTITENRENRMNEKKEAALEEKKVQEEGRGDLEEQALKLMSSIKDIGLGKNLSESWKPPPKAREPGQEPKVKEPKPKK